MHTSLLTFNAGEVSPYLRHRLDFEKTASSAETLRNFLPLPYGGVIKRPGLRWIADAAETAGTNSRALPFIASDGTRYILHFTPDVLTIYRTDGTVADSIAFMDGYTWPAEMDWEDTIRQLHIVQVNDVAFITHPGTFPLRLKRVNDTEWHLAFIPFERAPMLDENLDKNKTFTVASDPVAPDWTLGEDYVTGDVVFTDCEWKCLDGHTAGAANKPGDGADWRDYWQRMFYVAGDPVTLLADDREQVKWTNLWQYTTGQYVYLTADGGGDYDNTVALADSGADYVAKAKTDHDEPFGNNLTTDTTNWQIYYTWGATYNNLGDRKFHIPSGKVYECILAHMATTHEPTVAGDWATYWTLYETPASITQYRPDKYQAGETVSRKGRTYTCILDHYPKSNRTPGSGAQWETYWTETSRMVEEFAAGNFSPGQYFRISPERDERDFQAELTATGTPGDVKRSEPIAVQGAWNFNTFGTWWGTFDLQRSSNNGKTWQTIRSWQASGDRNIADTGIEDTAVLLRLRFTKEDGGTTESGLDQDDSPPRGLLIPESTYVTGYCLIDTYTSADEMTGIAKTSMMSGNTFRWAEGAFNSRDGFPRAICLHESRLVFAGTTAKPVSLWFSASDDLNNFETGAEADDGLYITLALTNASPIRWLASQRRLFIGTAFGEWVSGSETTDTPITPTNFIARQYSGYGSAGMQPLIANDAIFFTERRGTRLREMAYASDRESYDAADLSRLAEHLLRSGLSHFTWQQTREPGLWLIDRLGNLLHFAYSRTDRVAAWSRHDTTGGTFLDVIVLPSDEGDDEVFFIIDRSGTTTLERFPQHWQAAQENGTDDNPFFHLDGNLGSGTTITIPTHLQGVSITRLILEKDGTTYTGAASSTVTYPNPTATIASADWQIGRPVISEISSLPIDLQTQDGTSQARLKRADSITTNTYKSRGGHVWNNTLTKKQEIRHVATDLLQTAWISTPPDSGNREDLQFHLYHADPFPFHLRAATIRWQLNER